MDKKPILWILGIVIVVLILSQTNVFGNLELFTAAAIRIDPTTCTDLSLVKERYVGTSTTTSPCYPYFYRSPTLMMEYDAKTGDFLGSSSGNSRGWGHYYGPRAIEPGSIFRCYTCGSATILSNGKSSSKTQYNPTGTSNYCRTDICVENTCDGWEICKRNTNGCTYWYNFYYDPIKPTCSQNVSKESCTTYEKKCEGQEYFNCQNSRWVSQGFVVGDCGFFSDCTPSQLSNTCGKDNCGYTYDNCNTGYACVDNQCVQGAEEQNNENGNELFGISTTWLIGGGIALFFIIFLFL